MTLVACGRSGGGPLADTERAMAKLDAGRIDVAVMASADVGADKPVGFRMEGPFAYRDDRPFPELDLRYTSLRAGDQQAVRIVSDGRRLELVDGGGARTAVPPEQSKLLRLGRGDGGVADLGVAGWVKDATVVDRPDGTRLVTGRVEVGDLLSDLARINAQSGGPDSGRLNGDAVARLDRLVRHSEFTAELDSNDLPRTLRAVVDFGRELPPDLRAALGPYATPRLEVSLLLEPAPH